MCLNPELAAAATMTAVEALPGIDAAILFSDILLLVRAMGVEVEFVQGEGPLIRNPIRTAAEVDALRPIEPEIDLAAPLEAIRLLRRTLPPDLPLIGFAGAPFTLASYLIPGDGSRDLPHVKRFMEEQPEAWERLMDRLAHAAADHLVAQIRAGAQAVQLFDSWVGAISPDVYRERVLPHSRRIFEAVRKSGAPAIHFGTGTSALLELMRDAGGDVIGVDWRIPLGEAWRRIGPNVGIMGNLDPSALLGPVEDMLALVDEILRQAGGRQGHIFNLGHGILPETPVENVIAMIERVHAGGRP
jgi:uroporphyrinogen decarboxylase